MQQMQVGDIWMYDNDTGEDIVKDIMVVLVTKRHHSTGYADLFVLSVTIKTDHWFPGKTVCYRMSSGSTLWRKVS